MKKEPNCAKKILNVLSRTGSMQTQKKAVNEIIAFFGANANLLS